MNRSGIIYPPLQNTPSLSSLDFNSDSGNVADISKVGIVGDSESLFIKKTLSDTTTDNPYLISQEQEDTNGFAPQDGFSDAISTSVVTEVSDDYQTLESDHSLEQNTNYTDQNRDVHSLLSEDNTDASESNFREHKEFVVNKYINNNKGEDSVDRSLQKLQKSPYSEESPGSRKFGSRNSDNDNGYVFSDNKRNDRFRQSEPAHLINADKRNDGSLKETDSGRVGRRYSATEFDHSDSKKNGSEKGSKSFFRRSLKSKGKNASRKEGRKKEKTKERTEKSDGMLFSLMFIFEIFRWFLGSDVIVRFVLAAIAGIVGFGIIFSQAGALSTF